MSGAVHTPGQVGIADVSFFQDGYGVARVVKPSDFGRMWVVEIFNSRPFEGEGNFSAPVRRKIRTFYPIDEADAPAIHALLREKLDALFAVKRDMEKRYHEEVRALAQGGTQ